MPYPKVLRGLLTGAQNLVLEVKSPQPGGQKSKKGIFIHMITQRQIETAGTRNIAIYEGSKEDAESAQKRKGRKAKDGCVEGEGNRYEPGGGGQSRRDKKPETTIPAIYTLSIRLRLISAFISYYFAIANSSFYRHSLSQSQYLEGVKQNG
jgi:hypothetical protein